MKIEPAKKALLRLEEFIELASETEVYLQHLPQLKGTLYGCYLPNQHRIYINSRFPSWVKKETYIHEFIHAYYNKFDLIVGEKLVDDETKIIYNKLFGKKND